MILNKFKQYINEFLSYIPFGIVNAFKLVFVASRMNYQKRVEYERKIKYDYVSNLLNGIVIEKGNKQLADENKGPIWVCWWQGENNMPPIVQACWNKLQSLGLNKEIILITENNYNQYIEIDHHIITLLQTGKISITHFSDVLRFNLLYKHGGVWLDSTIYLNENAMEFLDRPFITLSVRNNGMYISEGKWSGFLFGAAPFNPLFKYLVDSYNLYYSKHDTLIDYFLMDYVIASCCNHDPDIKSLIDKYAIRCDDLYYIQKYLTSPITVEMLHRINRIPFNKLTWKVRVDNCTENSLYNYLIKK